MTARSEPISPTARQSLFTATFHAAQDLIATFPVTPADVAVAYLATGYGLITDPKVCNRQMARQVLVDLLAAFDADGPAPQSAPH
ncbi:MAG: hypothetical protein JNK40_15785 [Chromatiales bacterium]|nr:hypothetical protein [Chromatiales bacterium]